MAAIVQETDGLQFSYTYTLSDALCRGVSGLGLGSGLRSGLGLGLDIGLELEYNVITPTEMYIRLG